jgi:arylsulfatase A-like enzyme
MPPEMTATATQRQLAARTSPRPHHALLVAAWFGLAAGLLEGVVALSLRGVPGYAVRVSPDILWIAPTFNLLLFLLMGASLAALYRLGGKSPDISLLTGLLSWATLFGLMLLLGLMHQIAALILSLGVAVQIARSLRGREHHALRLFQRSVGILMIVTLFVGAVGALWDGWRERSIVAALPRPQAGAPNLLLITLDTLRADHIASYGYDRRTSPNIDRLAQGGAVFENAFSNSSWTLPSHASLFTGRLPDEHGADWLDPLNEKYTTLAEAMSAQGYLTGAFAANTSYVAPEWGLARGFSRFEVYGNSMTGDAATTVYGKKLALNLLPRMGYYDIPGRKRAFDVNREFLSWLDRNAGHPFFGFLNYFDLHDPYLTVSQHQTQFSGNVTRGDLINFQFQAGAFRRKPAFTPEEIQTEIDSYDGCLSYLDAQLGELVAELVRRGLDKNTLIIVTSDHGEAFGNHDLFGHGNSLYMETLRVPLIFYWPGRIAQGLRIAQPVSLHRIPSTAMELLSGAASASFPGESLTELLAGKADKITGNAVVSEVSAGRFKNGPPSYPTANGGLKSIVTDQWHLIVCESGRAELFAWRNDPQESHNLAEDAEKQVVVQQLKQQMEAASMPGGIQGQRATLHGSN